MISLNAKLQYMFVVIHFSFYFFNIKFVTLIILIRHICTQYLNYLVIIKSKI